MRTHQLDSPSSPVARYAAGAGDLCHRTGGRSIRTNDRTTSVLLALGANIGDPARQLSVALSGIERFMHVEAVSDLYRTEPIGLRDQPDFLNLVIRGRTELDVYGLHAALQRIEREGGRTRAERNGPRTIDLDLLAYGELALASAALQVPHPRMMERAFVLVPLAEVAPEWRHPVSGIGVIEALSAGTALGRVTNSGRLPGRSA